jgi:predicted enzyme related to lactoylglutathione lyase
MTDQASTTSTGSSTPTTSSTSSTSAGGSNRAAVTFDCVALDCADPEGVAQFYADLLGGTVEADPAGDWFTVQWDGPKLATQLAPNHVSPDWPRGQQQAHLDFWVVDVVAAHERVLELGGTALDPVEPPEPSPERGFRVYADPAGHPFCLCRPTKDAWD